jgi:hypothetical protein
VYRVAHQRVDAIWVLGWLQMEIMWQTSEFSAIKAKYEHKYCSLSLTA